MRWLRARVTRFAGVWLVSQLAIVVCLQTVMSATGAAQAVVSPDCACVSGTMCPMHHGRPAPAPSPDHGGCAFHGTSDPLGAVLVSLLGASAVVPPQPVPFVPSFARLTSTRANRLVVDIARVPDSPPPRG
jgi:hypothetical protein